MFRIFRVAVKAEEKGEENHSNGHGDKDETSNSFFTHTHACVYGIQWCCLFRQKQNHSSDDDHDDDVVDDDVDAIRRTYTNLRDVWLGTHVCLWKASRRWIKTKSCTGFKTITMALHTYTQTCSCCYCFSYIFSGKKPTTAFMLQQHLSLEQYAAEKNASKEETKKKLKNKNRLYVIFFFSSLLMLLLLLLL